MKALCERFSGLNYIFLSGGDASRTWSKIEIVARIPQYYVAVFFGRVLRVSADGQQSEPLNPSRIAIVLPLALLGGAAIYFGMHKMALIAAAVIVAAAIAGVVRMSYSEEHNRIYTGWVAQTKGAVASTDTVGNENVQRCLYALINAANIHGWFSGNIGHVLDTWEMSVSEGDMSELMRALLTVDKRVFNALYKPVGNFLMKKMTNREMARTIMDQVVQAAPNVDDTEKMERFTTFFERFVRRSAYYSTHDWISEICDAAKDNPTALVAVIKNLTKGQPDRFLHALARGFTVADLRDAIQRGRLPTDIRAQLAQAITVEANKDPLQSYADLGPLVSQS